MGSSGPLAGVRVVDLTAMVMGPYCTQIMADMGADVIKVEPPQGDDTRYISVGPAPGMSGVFVNVNRGKRGVSLDLKSDSGQTAMRALIAGADVFIHSMRAKAIGRLGLSYADVAAINPAIVYTNCYGYGRRGPKRDLPAYDDTIQAACGLPAVQQQLTGEANYVGTILADKVAGLTALYATMMALFHRERTGEGQEVEIGMFEAVASFMLVEHANGAMFEPALGPAIYPRTVAPNRRPYRTSDGYIAALIYNDKHWAAFIRAVRPPWASDLYATLEGRARQIDAVYALLAETMAQRTTEEWLDLFGELEIPAAPLSSPAELFDDPHLNAVDFFQTVETPHGPVRFPGVPAWFSRTPGKVAGPAPELGADTAQVLEELGLTSVETGSDAEPVGPF
ncbi:CoA transferase [Mycobacterium kubicae]|uniref:CoA transferase n=1 Tax=Mycobacterium kubicae TaxID=120959 RepID=A0AAX1JCZ8_9MYCO|nr:CoA transferase [Mycobacterium kubicae]MCV7093739.1 CoA transferase [Mycobacterium kubicae]OBF19228.1 acetyl-CoA acetyltransferase [Mycobacterium kubicae]OBK45498.1 acetyl-CoA acetyltransferase [Mycobacterium kubicae]ORW00773.1 acetyl-CoA acetyltransferase [Mycobacterium kubicae]QNI10107.1 CoA transferase [Mycobacterium kubicae]